MRSHSQGEGRQREGGRDNTDSNNNIFTGQDTTEVLSVSGKQTPTWAEGQRDGFKIDEDDKHKLHFYDVFSIHLGMNRATRCLRVVRISVSSEVSIYICR